VINVISAEMGKMRTARSSLVLILVAIGVPLIFAVLTSLFGDYSEGKPAGVDLISGSGFFAAIFTLIIGILAITGEMRHGSIAPSLLVTPVRERLLLAKLAAIVLICSLIGALAVGGSLGIAAILGPGKGFELGLSGGEVLRAIGSSAVVAALFGAIGLGVGSLLRNQAGAIVAVLIWLFVLDSLLVGLFSSLEPYSLTASVDPALGAGTANGTTDPVSQGHGLVVIAAYATVLVAAGTTLFRRVEITG
jgi:ABC-type transport system involved in multi-copper enzyme maturation permease subunit